MREREREVKGERNRERESERVSKILVKSPRPRKKAQTEVDYTKLKLEIITQNYRLVYYVAQKWVNYRDTGVYKIKTHLNVIVKYRKFLGLSQIATIVGVSPNTSQDSYSSKIDNRL